MVDQVTSADLPLVEWIPIASEGVHRAPYHLREWCEQIERCLDGGVRACCSVPIRHFKTWTTLYGISWLLQRRPTLRIILMCADHERSNELGKMCRQLCDQVSTRFDCSIGPERGFNLITDWRNTHGGGVCTMSAAQSRLGRDVDVLIADDPLDEHGALESRTRDAVDHALAHYAARAIRDGKLGSVLLLMSRWDPDDPVGRRLARKEETWTYIHHPALSDDGRAFCPEIMSAEVLEKTRRVLAEQDPSERLFFAQYQGNPRVAGADIFLEPTRYVELPHPHGFRQAMGLDLSYSTKAGADYFALIVGRAHGNALFLQRTVRIKADLNLAENEIRAAQELYGQCPVATYVSGPEVGAVQYLTARGIRVQGMPARFNKHVRSAHTRVAWNGGKIQVPLGDTWDAYIRRIRSFRGIENEHDDDTDALTSLYDFIVGTSVTAPRTMGTPRL